MRTLPTVKLQSCSHAGANCFKVFFPFDNAGLRARLEQFGLYYDSVQRFQMLRLATEAIEPMKAALREEAFLYVEQAGNQAPHAAAPARRPFAQAPPTLDDLPSNFVRVSAPEAQTPLAFASETSLAAASPSNSIAPSIPLTAACVLYHGEARIRLSVAPAFVAHPAFQQLQNCRWSPAMNAWHVAKTADGWEQVKAVFPEVAIIKSEERLPEFSELPPGATAPALPSLYVPAPARLPASTQRPQALPDTPDCLRIEPENRYRMKAFVPKHRKDWLEMVRSIPDRAWNGEALYWSLPMAKSIVLQLKEMFGEEMRLSPDLPTDMPENYVPKYRNGKAPETATHSVTLTPQASAPDAPAPAEDMVIVRYAVGVEDRVFLQVPSHRTDWIAVVKTIPGRQWLPTAFLWEVPRTKENFITMHQLLGEKLVIDKETRIVLSQFLVHQQQAFINKTDQTANSQGISPLFEYYEKDGVQRKKVIGDTLILQELNREWLAAYVPFDKKEWVKDIRGKIWQGAETYWKLPYSKETLKILQHSTVGRLALAFTPSEDIPDRVFILPGQNTPQTPKKSLLEQLNDKQKAAVSALERQLTLERKSHTTKKSYRNHIIQFFHYFPETLPSQISDKQIQDYFFKRINTDEVSRSTQSGFYSALQAFYIRVLEMPDKLRYVTRPEKEFRLPRDLEKKEVEMLINVTTNIKHKCLLAIMYGGGLRVGELVRLRIEDIDTETKTTFIYQSKNNKDRFTHLGTKTIPILTKYLAEFKPHHWLFESPDGGHYSVRSVQEIFTQAMAKAGIRKNLSTHALRHSFATHNIAKGMDIDFLRKLMGHESIKTTQIYLHVTKERLLGTISPIDDLDI